MNLPAEKNLIAQRFVLQQQLRTQRQEIIEQLTASTKTEASFPRSRIMRFLSGQMGLKILTGLAARHLVARHLGILANAFALLRLFKNKSDEADHKTH